MTVSTGNQYFVGARKGYVMALSTAGYPAATAGGATAYQGTELSAIKGFEIATPDARRISHNGNDRVAAVDFLPSLEPVTGEIRVAPSLQTLNASLMNVNSFAVGNVKMMPWQTEDQGTEADVSLHIWQQSLDRDTKLRSYRSLLIPRARAIPVLAGMNDNPGEVRYQVIASPSTKEIWGTSLTTVLEGATEAAVIEVHSAQRPKIVTWLADVAQVAFDLPAAFPSANVVTGYSACWVDGVLLVYGVGAGKYEFTDADTITLGTAPGVGKNVVLWYEY